MLMEMDIVDAALDKAVESGDPCNCHLMSENFAIGTGVTVDIDINKLQFYLGPTLSGSPVHFHRNTWNILVYGQKCLFLYPPDKAFYSIQHVWDWWRENHGDEDKG